MNAIEARQLTRNFGSARAVDSATIDVPSGTVFGLLGPNGAGKSTLLKLLVGHLRATSGAAVMLGQTVSQRERAPWHRLGYVSQARYLPRWMTAAECLRFTRTFHARWDEGKVAGLIERFALPMKVKIGDMSRGNYVRLQIALALAHNPELILLDEPTSGLDPVGRHELLAMLIDEIGLRGCTVVFSSHIVEDIERMADRVAIMDAGRIVVSDTVDAIKASRSRVQFTGSLTEAEVAAVPGLIELKPGVGSTVAITSEPANAIQFLQSRGGDAAVVPTSLEQVFFEYVHRRSE